MPQDLAGYVTLGIRKCDYSELASLCHSFAAFQMTNDHSSSFLRTR